MPCARIVSESVLTIIGGIMHTNKEIREYIQKVYLGKPIEQVPLWDLWCMYEAAKRDLSILKGIEP